MFLYHKSNFHSFFSFRLSGDSKQSREWGTLGPVVLAGFAVATAFYVSFRVLAGNGTINETFWKLLPLVVLFSFTNAWTEEILSRFVIIGGLSGRLPPVSVCWVSAVLFGLPHFLSGGMISVVVSGLLGWFLARSVLETKSLGWAVLIHFLLDIIVFGAGAMVLAGAGK